MNTVYISFSAFINEHTTEQLLAVTFDVVNKGCQHVYYLFSTPGGLVANGISLYNTLKGLPIKITMHNVGNVDSIGNAIFLAGKERFACPASTFMFHGVGFDINSTRFEERQLREKLDNVLSDQRKIGKIIADETSIETDEIEILFREASTKDADFALSKGIVHEIKDVTIPKGANLIQIVFNR